MPTTSGLAIDGLVKHNLAERLRAEIMGGSLQPGTRIVEGKWASKFGVAQGSIREAINILAQAGFVSKESGHSARVIDLSEDDVARIYQLRGAIEGLAARLAAATKPNLKVLQATLDVMRESANTGNCDGLLDCDSLFHLELCELSRNPYLIEHARRILASILRLCADACGCERAGDIGVGQRPGCAPTDHRSVARRRGRSR